MNASLENAERLSAFLDDELASTDVDALLDALENPACRQQMLRFSVREQLVQGAQLPRSAADDLGMRLRPQLQTPTEVAKSQPQRWLPRIAALFQPAVWIPAGGLAASALVGVVAWQLNAPLQTPANPAVGSQTASAVAAPVAALATANELPVSLVSAQANSQSMAVSAGSPRELVIPAPDNSKEIEQLYLQHARFRGGYLLSTPAAFARVGVQPSMATQVSTQADP